MICPTWPILAIICDSKEVEMGQVLIRNLDDDVIAAIKLKA